MADQPVPPAPPVPDPATTGPMTAAKAGPLVQKHIDKR